MIIIGIDPWVRARMEEFFGGRVCKNCGGAASRFRLDRKRRPRNEQSSEINGHFYCFDCYDKNKKQKYLTVQIAKDHSRF